VPRSRKSRTEPGIDAWRAVVVVLMFVVHARRLQIGRGAALAERFLDGCMWIEPYIAASFLFIAGISLVLSREKARGGWFRKILQRALALAVLSVALFVPQYGVELPDLIASSGILSAIALALVATAAALESARPNAALAAVTAVVLLVTLGLDRSGVAVSGLNAGPGGAFPLVAFASFGALCAHAYRRAGKRGTWAVAFASVPPLVLVLASRARWTTEQASYYHSHAGDLALGSLLSSNASRVPGWFWNHSALGAIGLGLPLALSFVAFLALGPLIGAVHSLRPLLLLGRHALAAYVLHLGLLGLLDLSGWLPPSGVFTLLVVAALVAAALVLSLALESGWVRRAAAWRGTQQAGTPASDTPESRNPGRPA
jgi:uncharacterized membrane protein